MSKKIRWGIISTAKIAREHLIPAIKSAEGCEIVAIASRSLEKARQAAAEFGIPKHYGSYSEMFSDPDIDVVYNPLPNNHHIPVSLEAARAGKHILCEKPVAMNKAEALQLKALPAGILFMEAFMVRFHPQWKRALEIVQSGRLGEVRAIQTFFSFFGENPQNIRNSPETGGGAMYDLGCYANATSKFIFGTKPQRVVALGDIDPRFNVDRTMSGMFDFGGGRHLTFTVSTQLERYQRVNIAGTKGRLEIMIPFNAPGDKETKILFDAGDPQGSKIETIPIPSCNQYRLQCEAMNRAIRGEEKLLYGPDDAIENMGILDAVFRSCKTGNWEAV